MSSITFLLSKIKTLKISLTVSIMILKKIKVLINSLNHENALSLFHINICSLSKNVGELEYLLVKIKIDFDVTGISESRITKDESPINTINLKGYSHESCPTEFVFLLCICSCLILYNQQE